MATWRLNRPGTWDYATLGFRATHNDVLVAAKAPDAYWSSIADGPVETVTRFGVGTGGDPNFVETADGSVLVYRDEQNQYLPMKPDEFVTLPKVEAAVKAAAEDAVDGAGFVTEEDVAAKQLAGLTDPTPVRDAVDARAERKVSRERLALLGTPPNQWFTDSRYGLFCHYTYGGGVQQTIRRNGTVPSSVEQLAAEFDAEQFAEDAAAFGAEYVIFTAWHLGMHALYPSVVLNSYVSGHATTGTDAIRKLIDALKPRGIKFALYVHLTDGHDMSPSEQAATGWNDSSGGYAAWQNFVNALMVELGTRYGTDLEGVWVDMLQDPETSPTRLSDKKRLRASLLAGHPGRVLMGNSGTNDNVSPSGPTYLNVVDFTTHEYIVKPVDMDDWLARYSHNAAIPTVSNEWWAVDPQGGASNLRHAPAKMFRYTVLQAGASRYGGGMSWAVSPYAGSGDTSLWEDGVQAGMMAVRELIDPIRESVIGTTPSTSYLTSNTATLSTLAGGYVATRSADGLTEYVHVLNPPSGSTLTLPAPADKVTFIDAVNLATGHPVKISLLLDGSYTLTLTSGDVWSSTDTVIALTRQKQPGDQIYVSARQWGSTNGALYGDSTGGNRYAGWTLSETTDMQVQCTYDVPPEWSTYDILVDFVQPGGGSGNAELQITHAQAVPGGSLAVDGKSNAGVFAMPGAADGLKRETMLENVRNVPDSLNHLRVARLATGGGDTGPSYAVARAILRRRT